MWPVSSVFGPALRDAHTMVVRVDAYLGATLIAEDMPIDGGQVTIHPGDGVRRTLDVRITDETLWPDLDVIGVELRPYRGLRYPSGEVELVPLGVFGVDKQSMSVRPGEGIAVQSAPDRWARVQRARFEIPATSVRGRLISDEIVRLVTEAVPGVAVTNTASSTVTLGALVWDRDRDTAVTNLATSISAEVFFDNEGNLIVRDAPKLSATPVWTVDASPSGVLLGGSRDRDRSRTYNVVVVTDGRTSGWIPFTPQIAADTDPTSRTWVGGPFGRVPYFWSSPAVSTTAQALTAARSLLNKVKALNAQLSVESVVHPALDRGDVIHVTLTDGTTELHLLDGLTVPLDVGGTQQITTRSSRPEGDVPNTE